jgi:hypothetical protein
VEACQLPVFLPSCPFAGIVSGQKKRFQDDGFDLDLAYISPRIVAMGLPAERAEMLYRNPMPEIARFLHTYHKNHAKVYNLCSEHAYGPDKLLTALQHYPFDDHQVHRLLVQHTASCKLTACKVDLLLLLLLMMMMSWVQMCMHVQELDSHCLCADLFVSMCCVCAAANLADARSPGGPAVL